MVLLDTHALIWWLLSPERLSALARTAIEDADEVFVSAVSIYEIDIKRQDLRARGRDSTLLRMPKNMPATLGLLGLSLLDITPEAAWRAALLPLHHRDPWDRILVAQADAHDLGLVSKDKALKDYDVDLIW
ncbi:type II toxin-antitoxin system VapC family toxin [Phenylobacterium sp.]|uniref:type II toxin-antitoxin system VapC family toxin n=1 Tax=Phenylobacterium sp. TaxID=1871053 RepID=UPI003982E0F4